MQQSLKSAHSGAVIWLTGLSGAGKSTLSNALAQTLHSLHYSHYVLDGDRLREGLNANLGFSPADRTENVRRVGEVAALFADAGLICIVAVISPYAADRATARAAAERMGRAFHEVHVATDLATCEARDPKGLYRRARSGQLQGFTGIDAPYEIPQAPQLRVQTAAQSVDASVMRLVDYVKQHCPLL
ncbi:adenylyl-sulfate kinase [Pseudomonas sp. dw_358]|uniref:adenylyl-sulfate kinase n=1 Tax=Pseudomonas sp. dw_358 TaxID=2720083 RepID=UPI001BD6BC21|nr:adenylyl-sulfate kinase [Pseudomonas sp. dw_358]